MIRVLVVDDHAVVRAGLTAILASAADVTCARALARSASWC